MDFQSIWPLLGNCLFVGFMAYGVWQGKREWFLWPVCAWGTLILLNQTYLYFTPEATPFNPGQDRIALMMVGFCGLVQAILAWPTKTYPTTTNREGQTMIFKIAWSHIFLNIAFALLVFNMQTAMGGSMYFHLLGWTHVAAAAIFFWAWTRLKNGQNWTKTQ